MHIVHANKAYWPHLGGVETVVRDLAEGAVAEGHTVTAVVCGAPERVVVDGVTVTRARQMTTVKSVPVAPTYPILLLKERADVLHVHEPSVLPETILALGRPIVRRRFGRLILSWHSDVVRQRLLLRAVGPLLRGALQATDVIIAATPNHLLSSPWLEEFEEKVTVIPYGVDPAVYRLDAKVLHRVEELKRSSGDRPRVLFLGRLVYYKGIEPLLEAAGALDDAFFTLVGQGPLAERVRSSVVAKEGRLELFGPVSTVEKVALLHACDVLVLPSTERSEAFGIVLLEAMACGKPVVTYDLPTGVTWINRDGVNGLVARLDEPGSLARALERLLADEGLRGHLGAAGRARIDTELNVAEQVRATLAVYEAR